MISKSDKHEIMALLYLIVGIVGAAGWASALALVVAAAHMFTSIYYSFKERKVELAKEKV